MSRLIRPRRALDALAAAVVLLAVACGPVTVTTTSPSRPAPQTEPLPPTDAPIRGSSTRALVNTFAEVARTVEPVAERICRQNRSGNCDFRIVIDDRPGAPPNAFQTVDRNGRPVVALTMALIADARNRDELAFVLAHETAHHIAGHLTRQREAASLGAAVFGRLASSQGASGQAVRAAQQLGSQVGARTFSRDFELEADRLGVRIAASAGFDPLRGAAFFARIPDPGNRFLGTHPPNAQRYQRVQQEVARLGL